jgi:phosphinothricin acetyltransferase
MRNVTSLGGSDDERVERRARIRTVTPDDLEAVNDIYNHYVRTSHATFDLEAMTVERRRAWLDEHDPHRHPVLVATRDERIVGYASAGRFRARPGYDTTVETSVYVDAAASGTGVGTSLYAALFDALAGRDLHRAVAGIALPNDASVALHVRAGFQQVAHFTEQGWKFERYWDVAWFERPLA